MVQKGFTANQIKLLACAFMLVDHIGYLLLPQYLFLRIIGRLSFPLFAFMIANGYRHSANAKKYLLRLAIFALCYQPVFAYCIPGGHWNIFATLFFGLCAIVIWEETKKRRLLWLGALGVGALSVGAYFLPLDYGAYGVLLIFTAHLGFANHERLCWLWLAVNFLTLLPFMGISSLQVCAVFSLVFLFLYNGKRGKGNRWFFYLFYCLHIPALYGDRLVACPLAQLVQRTGKPVGAVCEEPGYGREIVKFFQFTADAFFRQGKFTVPCGNFFQTFQICAELVRRLDQPCFPAGLLPENQRR